MSRALISVSDKSGIVDLAKALVASGIEIISTGGTKRTLEEASIETLSVEEVTGFPEMMDGRVKTLNPLIHGALLGVRDNQEHLEAMAAHKITPIDYVIVNLYPFKETILKEGVALSEVIENIDIGGPSMLRSAAKNYQSVTVLTDPNDYQLVLDELKAYGHTQLETREYLAIKAYQTTAAYDSLISNYLAGLNKIKSSEKMTLTYELKQNLRYGENSHQEAQFYVDPISVPYSIAQAKQLHGKELSYNNIKDADAALRIVSEFDEPCAVALKHMNPCGVGVGKTLEIAFDRCYESDPVSIFGGIVVLNRPVTLALAEKLHAIFLEIVIAPGFEKSALELLAKKKNIRLLEVNFDHSKQTAKEYTSVMGGMLVQDQDLSNEMDPSAWELMTTRVATEKELAALTFAWKIVKHVKSNAIVVTNENQTLGIGAGQMNRVGAAKIALEQAKSSGLDLSNMVIGSDAFFPMDDTVALAGDYHIKAIVQPGGSIKDSDSVTKANELDIAMYKTNFRHFRH